MTSVKSEKILETMETTDFIMGSKLFERYCKGINVKVEGSKVYVTYTFDFQVEEMAKAFAKAFAKSMGSE